MTTTRVFDCVPFFNELDMLEIRLHELDDVVDIFVIVEWKYTHSGQEKEFIFEQNFNRFEKYHSKIRYIKLTSDIVSPVDFWANENFQRRKLEVGLYDVRDSDIVMVSDLDEIPYAESVLEAKTRSVFPQVIVADNYCYNFSVRTNTLSQPEWSSTVVVRGLPKNYSGVYGNNPLDINSLRTEGWNIVGDHISSNRNKDRATAKQIIYGGWHLCYFMSAHDIQKKLKSFAHKELNKEYPEEYIQKRIANGEDLFLRPDHNGWKVDWRMNRLPKLVKENPKRFAQFLPKKEESEASHRTPLFSVVLIARNESKTISRLMKSLKEFQERGGEVVLVDTGSTDDTPNIARSLGCKVEEVGEKFIRTISEEEATNINNMFVAPGEQPVILGGQKLFDFSSARNYAASLAKNDMVAMPDCDEVYSALNIDVINKEIESGAEQLEYNFVFSHDEYGREAIKFLHSKFYNRKKLKWVRVVHEVLNGDAQRKWLDESTIKLEHWQNPEQNRGQYLQGLAYDCFVDPQSDRNFHYFGRELFWSGRPDSAITVLKQHLKISIWIPERAESMLYIGDAHKSKGEITESLCWYARAFFEDSSRREPMMKLAEHYYTTSDVQRTITCAEAALTLPHTNFYAVNMRDYTYYPHEMLYWAYFNVGNKEKSKEHFDKALSFEPLHSKFLYDYRFFYSLPSITILLPTRGDRPGGLDRCIKSIKNLIYPDDRMETMILYDNNPTIGLPKRLKEGVSKSSGEWVVYASDDVEFTPTSLMIALLTAKQYNKRLVAFNTGPLYPDGGNICEHFIIRRDLIADIGGEIFDTDFHHVGVDNLLWAKAIKLNEAIRAQDAEVKHYHFSKGNEMDETYKLGWRDVESDRLLLKKKLDGLNRTIQKKQSDN